MSRRSRYLFVCTKRRAEGHAKGSCAVRGGEELLSALKLATGRARVDARVTSSGCFELCWVGAAVAVTPDNVFLKGVTLDDVPRLVEALADPEPGSFQRLLADRIAVDADFIDPTKASKAEEPPP